MTSIFVSYRREDSSGFAGRLCDSLVEAFGSERVFRDVDSLRGAEDFEQALDRKLRQCTVMLVVIGRHWSRAVDGSGQPRLQDPQDWVRREVEEGLARKIAVMPVLVDDAQLPAAADLPPSLLPLLKRQAAELRDGRSWDRDVELLLADLRTLFAEEAPSGWLRGAAGRRARWLAVPLLLGAGALLFTVLKPADRAPPADSDPLFDVRLDERESCFSLDADGGVLHAELAFRLFPLTADAARVAHAFLGIVKVFDSARLPEGSAPAQTPCSAPACLALRLQDDPERPIIVRGASEGPLDRLSVEIPATVREITVFGRYYQKEGAAGSHCRIDPARPYQKGAQLPYLQRVDDEDKVVGKSCDAAEETRVIPVERRRGRYCLKE